MFASTKNCKPVYPSFLIAGAFISGFCYGNTKQQGLYSNARTILKEEDKVIEEVRAQLIKEEEYALAVAKGQDPSLINIPKGLQGLAKSFKRNFSEKKTVEAK